MEKRDRVIYDAMKERFISTLRLNEVLKRIDIHIPQRTLQYHLDSNFSKCMDDRIKSIALKMIKSYDNLIEQLKLEI